MSDVLVPVKPVRYLSQGLTNCGLYAVEGVLSAYGKNLEKMHPSKFHMNFVQYIFGLTPASLITKVLGKFGIAAQIGDASTWSNEKRLEYLKQTLATGRPIIIRIGGAYYGDGIYKPFWGKVIGHWVTLWGYNDETKQFYIYDSAVAYQHYQSVPVGNVSRSYIDVLRDWGQGLTPFPNPYQYVEVLS